MSGRWYFRRRGQPADEAALQESARRNPGRTVTFSDGVFAISITLLVLEIQPPEDTAHLGRALAELWPSFVAYALSFLLVASIWVNHHVLFDQIVAADRGLLLLNTVLLMTVAFVPFAASVLAAAFRDGQGEPLALLFFGGPFALGTIFFSAIWQYALRAPRVLHRRVSESAGRIVSRRLLAGPLLTLLGAAAGAVIPVLGLAIFALTIPVFWLPLPALEPIPLDDDDP
ncbi:TMEM175 family protein [Micromonospora sp. WMMD1155]|uniref:TMEM175 family protein n=1 Tax=Micromonospora sp. WMMD1155 TaxID=3016094 RepID=UPI00249C572B|nr:TMEM175 family protein [Micromonospora sp. WMMD1155]WFE48802.1 TMEM175 family protein [Micromonospora sp. WMMD1155]WFE54954.1 TMEM175 family protein [Micromonospora sp. WMMD1155]